MRPPAPPAKTLALQLGVATLGANFVGAFITQFYFDVIEPVGAGAWLAGLDPLEISVSLGLFILLAVIGWRGLPFAPYEKRLLEWYERLRTGAALADAPPQIFPAALNEPRTSALTTSVMWTIAALVFGGLSGQTEAGGWDPLQALRIFAGILAFGGVVTTVVVYFAVDLAWRPALPVFFPDGRLSQVPAFRLPLLWRLLVVFLLTGFGPLALLVILSLGRAREMLAGPDPGAVYENLRALELFLLAVGALISISMAVFVAGTVVNPLRRLRAAMDQVGRNDLSQRVPVTTNDELGVLSERFNDMALGLGRRQTELNTVYQVTRDVSASLELDQTLQTMLERVRTIIAYDAAEVCLYDATENVLTVRAWSGSQRVVLDTHGRSYRLGEGYTGWIGQARESLLVPDVAAHTAQQPVTREAGDGVAIRCYLGVPLTIGIKLVGTLELISTQPGAFDDHSRQLLETMAPQTAIAIENAAQVQARERMLKAQIEQMRIQIDEAKQAQEVAKITETDYFQDLQGKVRQLRRTGRKPKE